MSEGQASYAHVTEILAGLTGLGWRTTLHATQTFPAAGLWRRLRDSVRLQLRSLGTALKTTDVLYVRWHPVAVIAVMRARRRRVPVVLEVNGPPEDFTAAWPNLRPMGWVIMWSLRVQLRMSTGAVTVTRALADWLCELAPISTVAVVPNAADPQRFHPGAGQEQQVHGKPYALFFGALAPWQGVDALLEASQSPAWPQHLALLIVGDGQLRDRVEKAASDFPQRLKYLGRRSYAEMPALVASSSVVVIPKNYHRPDLGLSPLKLYESMASGTAVVVTDLPGLGDVVENEKCGLVVSSVEPLELASAVGAAADRPELGDRGRAAAVARHTWRARAEATDELLRRVTEAATPPG
jgi:glycosyltransferase involved in cell wall biosynthesis